MPVLATNRRALYDYTILEKFEAGIALIGHEVKSVKGGNVSLKGAYVAITGQGAMLLNAHIGRYAKAGPLTGYDARRTRKLLLTKKELKYLQGKTHEQGLTLVPLSLYTKRALIKVEIALARGKKKYDKREAIKKREWQRQQSRNMNQE